MEFINMVLDKLGSILEKYEFQIIEQRDNYLKLQNKHIELSITHNPFENLNVFWIGSNNSLKDKIEIDDEVLKLFFKTNLRLSHASNEIFINNLKLLFKNEAQQLLLGDTKKINELEKFDLVRSKNYTNHIIQKQILEIASKAWEKNNYKEFIKTIDEIGIENLNKSIELKYKIAKENIHY